MEMGWNGMEQIGMGMGYKYKYKYIMGTKKADHLTGEWDNN